MSFTSEFKLKGLTCKACAMIAQRQFLKLEGIISAKVDLESGAAEIVSSRRILDNEIKDALSGTGFTLSEN